MTENNFIPDFVKDDNCRFEVIIKEAPTQISLLVTAYWKLGSAIHLLVLGDTSRAVEIFHTEFVHQHLSVDIKTYDTFGETIEEKNFHTVLGPLTQVTNGNGYVMYHMMMTEYLG